MTTLVRSIESLGNSSAGYTADIDCTGGNLLIAKVMYTGSGGTVSGGAPTVGGTAMTSLYIVDEWQSHIHIFYMENPPTGVQTITMPGNASVAEQFVAELYSGAGTPETPVSKASLTATDSVAVTTGGAGDVISTALYVGAYVDPATPTSPVVDHHASTSSAGAFNTGARAGTGGSDTVEYTSIDTSYGRRLVAFNIPDTSGPAVSVTETELTPGGIVSGSYSNYETIPTTLTLSDGTNTVTIAGATISDNGDGTGTFSGTVPNLPTSGTANLVLFGNVTVELS